MPSTPAPLTQLIYEATGGKHPPRGALTAFADQIGTSTSTITRWRAGTVPDSQWWSKLGKVLGLTGNEVVAAVEAEEFNLPPSTDALEALGERLSRLEDRLDEGAAQDDLEDLTRDVAELTERVKELGAEVVRLKRAARRGSDGSAAGAS